MPDLIVKGVCKSFDGSRVLEDITLELDKGELMVLLGPSGCGKTTLLRLIAGLETVDEGEIYINAHRVDNLSPRDRKVAMVFQNYSLYPHMTVEKNLAFPLKVAGVPKPETSQRVREVARMLGLEEKLHDRPAQLSGGQRQRVALGRAIIRRPDLFLLDEPLSNLDADLRARMRQEIVRVQKTLGVTTVYVTHDQAEALTMADRIALLHKGRIVQTGSPEELYQAPANLIVAEFLGHPKINIIDAHLDGDRLTPFDLPASDIPLPVGTGAVKLGLRPECIEIGADGQYAATVSDTEYLGDQYVASIDFQGTTLTASGLGRDYTAGETVRFTFDRRRLLAFDAISGERLKRGA
jgi:multiple sugar transport system ATP-binding protein